MLVNIALIFLLLCGSCTFLAGVSSEESKDNLLMAAVGFGVVAALIWAAHLIL